MKPKGYISYFGLEKWWLSLSEEEREQCRLSFEGGISTDSSKSRIDEGDYITTISIQRFYWLMSQRVETPNNLTLFEYLLEKAELEAKKSDDFDLLHFIYMRRWRRYKDLLKYDENEYYPKLIKYLKKDNELFEDFKRDYLRNNLINLLKASTVTPRLKKQYEERSKNPELFYPIPNYPSFKELAIVYERLEMFIEAIAVVDEAINKGVPERTSFPNRRSKLEKKLSRKQT